MSNDFFDMKPKQSMLLGLSIGVACISTIGFFVLLLGGASLDGGSKVAGTNTNIVPSVPTPSVPTPSAPTGNIAAAPVRDSDHVRGNPNAKVTLIEYSDFECPFCGRHVPTITQILDTYPNDVRFIYRHFPLTSIHPNAQKAAEASECASEQGKFWQYHDLLFQNQTALGIANLKQYAGQLGLNQSQFNSCLDSGKYASLVSQQGQEAQTVGVNGTPGTFVNSQLVSGAVPFTTFQQLIEAE